jgi:hypothetical protein
VEQGCQRLTGASFGVVAVVLALLTNCPGCTTSEALRHLGDDNGELPDTGVTTWTPTQFEMMATAEVTEPPGNGGGAPLLSAGSAGDAGGSAGAANGSVGGAGGSVGGGGPAALEPDPSFEMDAGAASVAIDGRDASGPFIVEVLPKDGAVGVRSNAVIMVRFSEPMDTRFVEEAFSSSDMDAHDVEFRWAQRDMRLMIIPSQPLAYARGSETTDPVPINYRWGFSSLARDLDGTPMEDVRFSFSTLRQVVRVLPTSLDRTLTGSWTSRGNGGAGIVCDPASSNVCVGDGRVATNGQYKGFFTFDLTALDTSGEIASATLRLPLSELIGNPFESLGNLTIQRASFTEIGEVAFDATTTASFLGNFETAKNQFTLDVTDALNEQLAEASLAQYAVSFDVPTNRDGKADIVGLDRFQSQLVVTQLIR